MNLKFKTCFNGFLVLLLLVLFWSVWTGLAQTPRSNAVPVEVSISQTNTLSGKAALLIPMTSDVTPAWVENLAKEFPVLTRTWWGNELWKYLASLIYIFLAFYVSKFLDFLTRVWLKRWAAETETKFDDLLLDLLNGPVKVVAFVIFLHIGLSVFSWPVKVQVILAKGFTVVVACTLTYMILKFVDLALGYWRKRAT